MKVALLTPYWSPIRGGITTYVQGLAAELREAHGIDVVVISRQGQADDISTVVDGSSREFVRNAERALESLQPEVVHAHGHWYTLAAGIRYRRRHPGARVVFTLHTPFPRRTWLRRLYLRILLSRADWVTGVSADLLRTTSLALRFRTRTRVTYAGVTVRHPRTEAVSEFLKVTGLANRRPLIGYIGRLVWDEKVRGVARLIRAMGTVRASFPSATLVIAGDGPHRGELEEVAAREAPDGVVFLGDVPDPLPRFYGALDLYAHISFQEGLPMALLEAMACGRPVVASAVGGIPEAVRNGQNGFLVFGEAADLAARITELLSLPELAGKLATNAMADASSRFSLKRCVEQFLPLYGVPTRHRVAITIDLERDFHAGLESFRGVEEGMPKLLDLLEDHQIPATVFATADLCGRFPNRLEEIHRRGHAIGCHGESHAVQYLSRRSLGWQQESLRRATSTLERCIGVRPRGFRAPNFSANGDTIRVLEELGFEYDSSVLPGRVVRARGLLPLVDFRGAPRDPYRASEEDIALPGSSKIWELPVAENPLAPGGPIGLGFLNAYGVEKTLEAIARSAADPCTFLIHPWELVDPPPGRVPEWMKTGCTSDASALDAFLARVRRDHQVTTLEQVLAGVR